MFRIARRVEERAPCRATNPWYVSCVTPPLLSTAAALSTPPPLSTAAALSTPPRPSQPPPHSQHPRAPLNRRRTLNTPDDVMAAYCRTWLALFSKNCLMSSTSSRCFASCSLSSIALRAPSASAYAAAVASGRVTRSENPEIQT
eukprot:1184500-Prorocentrum_minimum.AAC.2